MKPTKAVLLALAFMGLQEPAQGARLQGRLLNEDPGCKTWNYDTNSCDECSHYYYMNSETGMCTRVSSQCNGYNEDNGHCTGCWDGYHLHPDGTCQSQAPPEGGEE